MYILKYLILITAITTVVLTGCKKSETVTPVLNPDSLNDLKASDSFDWTTATPVEMKITGLPTVLPVKSTLTISLANGTTIFSKLHQMDHNLTLNLTVPSTEKELILKYGSVTHPLVISNNQAFFSFIPVVTEN